MTTEQSSTTTESTTTTAPTTTAEPATTTEPTTTTTEPQRPLHESGCELAGDSTVRATAQCIDGEWPLTSGEAEVYCNDGAALMRVPGGPAPGVYPLNGFAKTRFPDLPELETVWLPDPELEGVRVSIGPILDIALSLCE